MTLREVVNAARREEIGRWKGFGGSAATMLLEMLRIVGVGLAEELAGLIGRSLLRSCLVGSN